MQTAGEVVDLIKGRQSASSLARAAGVPTSTVSRIANGTVDPTVAMLSRLVEASDATLDLSVTFHANAPATDPANLTLAEAARHLAEQCEVESVQRTIVHDFIRGSNETHFTRRRSLVADKPEPTGDPRYDALLGGLGEHLALHDQFPAPTWVFEANRYLTSAWYWVDLRSYRDILHGVTPAAFLHRNIYIDPADLTSA